MAEETKQLSLNIDAKQIQLIVQQAVRRASMFMAVGLGTAKSASLASLKLDPSFPVAFLPEPPGAELLLNARVHFGQWVIGNALRELTGGFANFLDRVFEALLIIKYHGRRAAPTELQQQMKSAIEDLKLFGKLERIESSFGVTAKFKSCFPSISLARDALALNLGKVRDRDCNEDKTLRLSWIGLKSEPREKIFKAGEQIDLSTYELSEICWTFAKQADELVEQMMLSAQFKGLGAPPAKR